MARRHNRKPDNKRLPQNKPLPTEPGMYYWTEWGRTVEVYRKGRGTALYVTPPGGIEVKVSPFIAGRFEDPS